MTSFFNKTSNENFKKYMLSGNFQASIIVVISSFTTRVNLPMDPRHPTRSQLDYLTRQFAINYVKELPSLT